MKIKAITITKKVPTGFTFVEAIISMLILAIFVGALFTTLTFVASSARRATTETEGNMHAIQTLEKIISYPYAMVTTNYFPVEYVSDGTGLLVYALTTTITEVTSPTLHKEVTVDYTWCEGRIKRYSRYYYIKSD